MKYFVRAILATIIAALLSSCSYNSMVEADENINAQWAKVENQYQRRADLVPNLVNTVKGYAAHESETLEAVIAARSKATQITVDPANLTEENLQKFQEILVGLQIGIVLGDCQQFSQSTRQFTLCFLVFL